MTGARAHCPVALVLLGKRRRPDLGICKPSMYPVITMLSRLQSFISILSRYLLCWNPWACLVGPGGNHAESCGDPWSKVSHGDFKAFKASFSVTMGKLLSDRVLFNKFRRPKSEKFQATPREMDSHGLLIPYNIPIIVIVTQTRSFSSKPA